MTKERNRKTLSLLQEEDTEPLREEEEPLQIVKIDKDKRKVFEKKEKRENKKNTKRIKGESEIGPKPGLP